MSTAPGTCRKLATPVGCAVMAATLLVLGCGGGGGDSDSVTCTALSFARALQSPAVGDVYLDESNSTCSTVEIAVVASNVSGIFTTSFDISYPASRLQYSSYTLGPLMTKGPPTTTPLVLANDTGGTLEITITRFSPDTDVNASGSEAMIYLRFARVAAGSGIIDFDTSGASSVGEVIYDQNGSPASPASFAPGHGGMVTVP